MRTASRGIATIEFVLAVPVLMLLVFAIAELGRAFVQYTVLANSIRNAARYVAGQALNGSTGLVSVSAQLQTQGQNLAAYGSIAGGTPILPGLTPSQITVANAGNGNVSVSVEYPYASIFGATLPNFGFSGDPISLVFDMTAAATLRALP
jgi:Flp pilus assembly protein TadG